MAINAGTIYSELVLKGDKFFDGLSRADRETQSFESKLKNFGESSKAVGKSLTTKLTLPIVGVAAAATMLGMNFDSSMSEVQAISGATGEDMKKLEGIAREMGATTKFSATDAADGLKYMSMAGWDTNQMMSALPGVLDLAAASGTDLGIASDIVTDALTGFGLQAQDTQMFVDLLASASSNSNTNVELMGETFKYVAPLFGALGYSAEDAALATGLMANAGIKGGQAGTALRAAITRLVNPTKESAAVMKELGIELTDANGEMKPFDQVLGELRTTFSGLTEEQKAQKAATLFGKEAMSGMLAIINASDEDYQKLTKATTDYNGAAKEMAETMQDNLKGSLEKLKSSLEETGLKIYEIMLPSLQALVEKVQKVVDWFSGLDESTQKSIVKFAATAAAVGPVLLIFGTLAGSISKIIGVAQLAGGSLGLLGGAAATAGGAAGVGGLTLGLGGVIAAAAPFVLAGGAIVGVGALIKKNMSEEVIPEVDLFAEKIETTGGTMQTFAGHTGEAMEVVRTEISEGTKEAVQAYLDMEEGIRFAGDELYYNSTTITEEIRADMEEKYNAMTAHSISAVEVKKEEELRIQRELFAETSILTEEEQASILESTNQHYTDMEENMTNYKDEITKIYETASDEKRHLKKTEKEEIARLEGLMKEDSVKVLSETEVESKIILERMKGSDERITAEMASERIKKLNKLRDDAITKAEETYDGTVAAIIRMRDETGTITAEQATQMIAEADRAKKDQIKSAEETRNGVVDKIFTMNRDLEGSVNDSSGKILTKWDSLKSWWENWTPSIKSFFAKVNTTTIEEANEQKGYKKPTNAHGTEYFGGGYTWVGEQGRELIKAPKGSKIYSNPKSEEMANQGKQIIQNITINSPTPLVPSEIARKNLQASRQLAVEWGV